MVVQMPAPQDVVLRLLLERNAAKRPEDLLVTFEDGATWSRQEGLDAAYAAGNAFYETGIRQGDAVAVFLPNCADFLRAWWGLASIGAVMVPVNLAFRGSMLQHLFRTSGCRAIVVDADRAPRVHELDDPAVTAIPRLDPALLRGTATDPPPLERELQPWDIALMAMTSGTTGPSKVSRTTYWHTCLGEEYMQLWGFGADDVFLVDLPLFHPSGIYSVMASLVVDARFALRSAPALGSYWQTARDLDATTAVLVSSMVTFLLAQPESEDDRAHRLTRVLSVPLPHDAEAFKARFGIRSIVAGYGSTEVPGCVVNHPDYAYVPGFCGRAREGFEVRLVDENDVEVPVGATGEAIIRTDLPWMLSQGYENNPDATVSAWRNGWFHSGDLLRRDADGNYFFIDRSKDSLRRRGENISTFEVEAEVAGFPGVAEVACVAAPSPNHLDDEVKVWVVPKPDVLVEPAALVRHCAAKMPHYMVPRYVEIVTELPKTPTAKVQKFLLRERGNGPATWDREAHGLRITRDGLVEG